MNIHDDIDDVIDDLINMHDDDYDGDGDDDGDGDNDDDDGDDNNDDDYDDDDETRRLSLDEEGENLPSRTVFSDNNLLSPTLVSSVSPYHRTETVRSRYDRESSTSDSVFSPDRRKSSASSKSLEDDMAMITGQEYPDMPRSHSESSTTWIPDASHDSTDRGAGIRYGIQRSPTSRTAGELSDRLKHVSKSPINESVENIKHITLSSPSEFQYKKYHHGSGYQSASSASSFDPQRLPPMFEFSKPVTGTEEMAPSYSVKTSSGTTNLSTGNAEDEMTVVSPVNLASSGSSSKSVYSEENSPSTTSASESVFSPYVVYKVPFSNYGERATRPKSDEYRPGFESDGVNDGKLKPPYQPPPDTGQVETFCTESREYQSELGEIYRLPKKLESKMYKQTSGVRKQQKGVTERRGSDSVALHAYNSTGSTSGVFTKDKDQNITEGTKSLEIVSHSDISKSFEEAVKIQQSIFHSSLGMLSPLQRQFLQPSRPCPQRERSQSLSDFHTLTSQEMITQGRARFPSSSYAENIDTPLVIDDDIKQESETREGLDLSYKKRKMSVDDVYPSNSEEQIHIEGAGINVSANQGEEQEFDRLGQTQGGATGRDDSSTATSGTKKYGKGNFIKVATGYQCRICCRVIRHMNNTTAHMRIHANVKPYKCQVCNQQFKYEVDRRYHFSKNHVDLFSKMYFPDGEKKTG
ncbi:hypothetical protein ACF0H5_024082 [Mactra antiquata]